MSKKRYLTAEEASQLLGINRNTLYAYVSRGLIRSQESPTRSRLYSAEDVQQLLARKEMRRDPSKASQEALDWGMPILESALTLIQDGELYFRGHPVKKLIHERTLEEVATLFWTGEFEAQLFPPSVELSPHLPNLESLPTFARLQASLPIQAAYDLRAYNLAETPQTGARILHFLTALITNQLPDSSIAESLAQTWCPDDEQAPAVLNAALILCADHELNASSFTARVVASAEANPYAVVSAGLAALSGFKHGRNTQRVEALFREVGGDVEMVIRERLQRGERIYGFGHPIYPEHDPRAVYLWELLEAAYPERLELANQLQKSVFAAIHQHPNIDFALVTMRRLLKLPPDAALILFGVGRTIGWIAHAIEQYAAGKLIRPRAKYVGDLPQL